ncbi:MAG: hypothetical protein HYY35_03965 [Deltaproteobacteria bacterium]|nr:hypothetical protein [Deltaproteobacteria bacterium]
MKGLTLVELLVSLGSSLLIVAAVAGFARDESRWLDREARRLRLREASRRVLEMVVRELRGAGFAPVVGGFDGASDGVSIAAGDRLEVRSDLHGATADSPPDGALDADSDERIGFFPSPSRGVVSQSVGRQTLSLTLEGMVAADGLAFRYFDACGEEISTAAGELSAADRARVRIVGARLTVRDRSGDSITSEASAMLRNRAGLRCR